ncbi:MAG: cytochrome c biogenesis CcdA family protein [Haloferacaceae archaeon]
MAILEPVSLLVFAFAAGAFTFFAPCAYPLLPGYVSYYLGRNTSPGDGTAPNDGTVGKAGRPTGYVAKGFAAIVRDGRAVRLARATVVGILVSAGFVLVYGLLAGVVVAVGTRFLAGISVLELVVGTLLVGLGGVMALGWEFPTPTVALPERRRSAAGYIGFGMLYAAAAAGCTAPVFIGVILEALAAEAVVGVATFAAYATGMSVLMVGVTIATALGHDVIRSRLPRRTALVRRGAGVLLLLAGLVEIYLFLFRFRGLALLGF